MIVCNHVVSVFPTQDLKGKLYRMGRGTFLFQVMMDNLVLGLINGIQKKNPEPVPYIVMEQCRIFFVLSTDNGATIFKSSLILQLHVKA